MAKDKITTESPTKESLVKVTRPSGVRVKIKQSLDNECLSRPGWKKGWANKPKKQEK